MHKDGSGLTDSIAGAVDVDRRTVNRAMAWSVPVVMAAVAAPATAASGSVTITSVTATYIPASGSTNATVSITIAVNSGRAGNTITFNDLAQGANSFGFTIPKSFTLTAGDNSVTIVTTASSLISPVTSILSYTTNLGGGTTAVPIAQVTKATQATRTGNGNSSTQTFTLTMSPRNADSALVITSMTSAASKPGDPAGKWTEISKTSWVDVGTGALTFTAKQPAGSFASAATVSGTIDGVSFTVTSN